MKLQVCWYPQVPCEPFEIPVDSVEQGVFVMDTLANYDIFQYENNIKPDYSNAGILVEWDEKDHEWVDWCDAETGEDDPREYLSANEAIKIEEIVTGLLEALKYARRFLKPEDVDLTYIDEAIKKAEQ